MQCRLRARECIDMIRVAESISAGTLESLVDDDYDWSSFKGRLDTGRAVVAGHSMGSIATLSTLALTDKFKRAFVALSPWKILLVVGIAFDGPLGAIFNEEDLSHTQIESNATPFILIQVSYHSQSYSQVCI